MWHCRQRSLLAPRFQQAPFRGSWRGGTLGRWGAPALLRASGMGAGASHGCGATTRMPDSFFLQGKWEGMGWLPASKWQVLKEYKIYIMYI